MRPSWETSHFSARLGVAPAVLGSSRVRPSNTADTMRISAMPVMSAGSRDSGSLLLMMTRSAFDSWRWQPVSKPAIKTTSSPDCVTRRNPLQCFRRGFAVKFIDDYFGGMFVAGTTALVAGEVMAGDVFVLLAKLR